MQQTFFAVGHLYYVLLYLCILGFGVFTTKDIAPKTYLCRYPGAILSDEEGEIRELKYCRERRGCFLYFFEHKGESFW